MVEWWLLAGSEDQEFDLRSDGTAGDPPSPGTVMPYNNFPTDGSDLYATLFWRLEGESFQCRGGVHKAFDGT